MKFIKKYALVIVALADLVILFTFMLTNNAIGYIVYALFVTIQIIIYCKIDKSIQKFDEVRKFLPSKAEKDGIRYLRGKRALEYSRAWDATNTELKIGDFRRFFLEIRLFLLKLTGLPKDYFSERHRYNPESRRALDLFALTNFELRTKHIPDAYYSRWRRLFYKYLKFKYRKEEKRFEYWIRITSHRKRSVYVWHEDIEKYKKQHNIHKMTEDEQNERERMLIGL